MIKRKLREKIEHLISKKFKGSEIVWDRAGNRIVGEMIWKGFVGKDHVERQEQLWNFLQKQLADDEQIQIAAILAATPYEVSPA